MSKNGNTTAALLGTGVAFMVATRSYRRQLSDDVDLANDVAEDALSIAKGNRRLLNELIGSGELIRLGADEVNDLLLGLIYPGRPTDEKPGNFAIESSCLTYPDLTEALAVSPTVWPGHANSYTLTGQVETPKSAIVTGQNVATGLALSHPNARAFLMGLTTRGDLASANTRAQLFRFTRALALAFGANDETPIPLDRMIAAWRQLLGIVNPNDVGIVGQGVTTTPIPSGVFVSTVVPGGLISTFTSEATYATLGIPANLLAIGQWAIFRAIGNLGTVGAGATLTLRVRLDGLTGPVLLQSSAIAAGTSEPFEVELKAVRQNDIGSSNQLATSPRYSTETKSGSSVTGTSVVNQLALNTAHTLYFTVQASASDPATRLQVQAAMGSKL